MPGQDMVSALSVQEKRQGILPSCHRGCSSQGWSASWLVWDYWGFHQGWQGARWNHSLLHEKCHSCRSLACFPALTWKYRPFLIEKCPLLAWCPSRVCTRWWVFFAWVPWVGSKDIPCWDRWTMQNWSTGCFETSCWSMGMGIPCASGLGWVGGS